MTSTTIRDPNAPHLHVRDRYAREYASTSPTEPAPLVPAPPVTLWQRIARAWAAAVAAF